MTQSKEERIRWWLEKGERGISSNTMLHAIAGAPSYPAPRDQGFPYDPDDFRRCHLLLNAVPELRDGFDKLAAVNPVWGGLVANWDKLDAMLVEAMKTKGGRAEAMYNLMDELRCDNDPAYAKIRRR